MEACQGNVTYEAIQQMEYTERVLWGKDQRRIPYNIFAMFQILRRIFIISALFEPAYMQRIV